MFERDELRTEYTEAFNVIDYNTRNGRAEEDWAFYVDDDGQLIAEPRVSGDSIYWDGECWRESDDDSILW